MTRDEAVQIVTGILSGLHPHPASLAAEIVDTLLDERHEYGSVCYEQDLDQPYGVMSSGATTLHTARLIAASYKVDVTGGGRRGFHVAERQAATIESPWTLVQ